MKRILIPALLLIWSASVAQIISDKTNDIAINFSNPNINTSLPTIEWIFPRMEYTNTEENRVDIQAEVNSKVPLKAVVVSIKKEKEGKPMGERAIDIDEGALHAEISQNLRMSDGQNWIEIRVETIDGGIVYDYRSIRVGLDAIADAVLLNRKDYALLIATDRYDNWNDLVNPIFDASSIAKELEDRYGFQVEVLKDANQDDLMTNLRDSVQLI